jgi:hypothetical protein
MNALTPILAELDEQTRATVADVAGWHGLSEVAYVREVVRRAAEADVAYRAFVQQGIDSAERGDLIPQDEMTRWFEERVAARSRG